jgi:hypothetical protein
VVDRNVGSMPLFTIAFLLLAVVATFIKMYYTYDTKMKAHDAESPWGRAKAHATATATAAAGNAATPPNAWRAANADADAAKDGWRAASATAGRGSAKS